MQASAAGEQVPQHELAVVQEEGQQKLQLSVKLPGLSSASDIQLVCSSCSIALKVPGQYSLLLPLDVTINDAADSVKFMKKKQTLTAKFTVISSAAATPAAANGNSSSSAGQQQQRQGGDAAQRAAAAAAAEESARREQQRRLNTEAADEWMRRGVEAAQSGNAALAEKALGKVGELAPHLKTAALRAAIAAVKQGGTQQQQQQHGSQAAGGYPSSQQQQQQRQAPPKVQQQQQHQAQGNSNSSSNAGQQSSSSAGAQQAGHTNGSSGAAPGNQQQQKQQQKQQQQQQHPKQKQKQKPAAKPPPQQQQGPSSSRSSTADGPPQQQQQQQRAEEADSGFFRSAWEQQQAGKACVGGLVGWWCRRYDRLEVWVVVTGELLNAWSKEPGRGWVASTAAQLCAVLLVAAHFSIMWLWRTGWTQPLHCAAYIRRTGGDTFIESQLWLGRTGIALTQHTLAAAGWRLALWWLSAAATAAAAWAVGWLQLWGHSLVGWAWLQLIGVWRALVWRPWHSIQLPLAVAAVLLLGFAGLGGNVAMWSLAMMLSPGGWLNLSVWGLAVAANMGLRCVPYGHIRITWSTKISCVSDLGGIVRMITLFNFACRWWGFEAFKNPVDPLPAVSWWWWLLLVGLFGFTMVTQEAERLQRDEERERQGGGPSSSFGRGHADEEPFYGGASETAYQKFVMGFGPVAVPDGCEVPEVKLALQARDYYQVMGFSSREECTPESLRAARKLKALAVHPDKVGHDHPGANLAAGRVNKAFETLSSEELRRAYDRLLDCHSRPRGPHGSSSSRRSAAAAAAGGGRAGTPEDASWLPPYNDSLYDIERSAAWMCDMDCPMGDHSHTVHILPQAPFGVRWCRECAAWHATKESGEVWAHWSPGLGGVRLLGRVRLLFAPGPDSPIFDITDLFKCGPKLVSSASMCNTHINSCEMMAGRADRRGGGGGGGGGGAGGDAGGSRRSRKKQGRRR